MRSLAQKHSMPAKEEAAMTQAQGPARTRAGRLNEFFINLIFPIERLRELEAQRVIGRLAKDHYGFGLMGSAARLMPSIKEVARRISDSGVDLLVPA